MQHPSRTFKTVLYVLGASLIVNLVSIGYISKKFYYKATKTTGIKTPVKYDYSKKTTYYLNRQTVYDLFPIKKNDVVFAGDSHTQRFDLAEYFPNKKIRNRGIDSDISQGLLLRLKQILPGHPSKLFIEIGFNDLRQQIPSSETLKNIDAIDATIVKQSPETHVYFLNVFPSNEHGVNKHLRDSIIMFNKKLTAYCSNKKVDLIDMYSVLSNNGALKKDYDGGDGIHLNGPGYLAWREKIKRYL
jgi:lysophospholipase L1-like esterase